MDFTKISTCLDKLLYDLGLYRTLLCLFTHVGRRQNWLYRIGALRHYYTIVAKMFKSAGRQRTAQPADCVEARPVLISSSRKS